ncbi:MAG TPA: putative peptidoglycan glycosyltransferase FtsW [Acidimicrobiales bacterium]|nr:putative peptidoglycan glycosyltransferase FtsW [Acidimicrobiales bacterium]
MKVLQGARTAGGGAGPEAAARRSTELGLVILAVILAAGGYVLTALAKSASLPADLAPFAAGAAGLAIAAHVAVRRFAPRADGTLLGLAVLLNGIGFVTIARLDPDLAKNQSLWTAVAVGAFILTLAGVRRIRDLERYRYTFALVGIGALLIPAIPGIGREINGARLWVQLGPFNFQPGEAAKVTLVIFLAAYLVEKRELLSTPTWRVGPVMLPDPKHFAPLLLAWGSSILVMVREKDLGSSLLFFAVFLAMLYMATARASYVGIGAVLFGIGATIAYQIFGHVRDRVTTWLDPWPTAQSQGFQLVQALFAFGSGGFAGTGLGLGSPGSIPNASTDFVFAAIGEELGLIGTTAVLLIYLLLVGVGFRIALRAEQPFLKLLAAGLTTILGVQTFIILGGVTRLIPLTGITMPFVSYGGSSLLANFVILALLLRISDEVARRADVDSGVAR